MMKSAEIARLYQSFQAEFSPDRWMQPLNMAAHREGLTALALETETYPATFSYSNDGIDEYLTRLGQVEEVIWSCKDMEQVAERVVEQLTRDRLTATAVHSRQDPTFTQAQRDLHGLPSDVLVRQARQLMEEKPAEQSPSVQNVVTVEELMQRMTRALQSYGLTDWYVQIEANMAAKASINGSMRRIRLRGNEVFSAFDADRIMVHEIGGHVLRWANSERQPEPWAQVPMGRTIPTEEGLAVCREDEFGLLDEKMLRKYQVRCLAVSVAANGGIMDVIRAIAPYVDRRESVEIAVRTKRGLLDPNSPGGATKDWGYFDGYLRMRSLHETSPTDYQLLSGVKWPVEDLPLIKDLVAQGRIVEPEILPDPIKLGVQGTASSGVGASGLF